MTSQNSPVLAPRELPHPLLGNIWMWSAFNVEKGLFFNGYAVKSDEELIIIDPPTATEAVLERLTKIAAPTLVILTNRDHERESHAFRQRFNNAVFAPQADAPLLEHAPEKTYGHGDILPGGLRAIHLAHQKSPGESALYLAGEKILFLGDALIGKPAGSLSMLPDDKYADKAQAITGLQALKQPEISVDTLLLGDGEPILQEAGAVLETFWAAVSRNESEAS